MFVLKGRCVDTARFKGVSAAGNAYDMMRYYILVGRSVYVCGLDDDYPGAAPVVDQDVTAEIRVGTYKDKKGDARLDVTLLRPVEVAVKPVPQQQPGQSSGPRAVAG